MYVSKICVRTGDITGFDDAEVFDDKEKEVKNKNESGNDD